MTAFLGPLATLGRRSYQPEILDVKDVPLRLRALSYRFMAAVNRWLGGVRVVLRRLPDPCRRVLDVGAGGGDIARAVARRRPGARVVLVELSRPVLSLARRWCRGGAYSFVRADGRCLPFRAGAFDLAASSMMFHHLGEADAALVLREMARVGRRVVVNDLRRNRRSYLWAWLFATLFGDPVVRVDGPRSVERSYTRREALALAEAAGLRAEYGEHFGHRFSLMVGG